MLKSSVKWLQASWWGLIVAHGLILFAMYGLLWTILAPLGISSSFSALPEFAKTRAFYHLIATLILGAYVTLALDLVVRREAMKSNTASKDKQLLGGVWKGAYTSQNNKKREVTLDIEFVGEELNATMTTETDQGLVAQKAASIDPLRTVSFDLKAESVTTSADRSVPWRPETWHCTLSKDARGDQRLIVEINDVSRIGSERTVAGFNMYRYREGTALQSSDS